MRQEKIFIASMSAILGEHYLGQRGRLDVFLLGWEYVSCAVPARDPSQQPGQDRVLSRDRQQEGGGWCSASFTGKMTTDA